MKAIPKEEFKQRFREWDDETLIENSMRPLTDEAIKAIRALLYERGLAGEALDLKISAVKKEIVGRSHVTSHCDFCGKSIVWSSLRSGMQRFCGERCRDESILLVKSVDIAADLIEEHAVRMKFGACPKCGIAGNSVEMRATHHVVAALVTTHYSRRVELSCRLCARTASLWAAASCLVFGWWSFSGLFSTPVQIARNIRSALSRRDHNEPSPALLMRARLDLARELPDFSQILRGIR